MPPPATDYLRTGERFWFGIDFSLVLEDGDTITSVATATVDRSTEPPFAHEWTADNATIASTSIAGSLVPVELDGASVVVGEWRRLIVSVDTSAGENRKSDPFYFYTDI